MNQDLQSEADLNPVAAAVLAIARQVDEEFGGVDEKTLGILDYDQDQKELVSSYISALNETSDLSNDLTLVLKTPFKKAETFSAALGGDLVAGLQAQENEFKEVFGIYPTFSKKICEDKNINRRFFGMCSELADQVSKTYDHVTLLLIPETGLTQNFPKWLQQIEGVWVDPKVQILVSNSKTYPELPKLPKSYEARTQRIQVQGDMDEIMMAAFDQSVSEIGPEPDFQKAIMNALMAIKQQDFGLARRHAELAYDIATENAWPTMQVMALIYYGSSIPHADQGTSIRSANQAMGILEPLDSEEDPSVPKLKYQVLMMKAQAYLTHKHYAEAAPEYEVANALAVEMENPLLELETARMASFCHYHGGDHMKAWEWGDVGLRAVEDMPKEAVPMTTFPFLVDHLDEVRLRGGLNESERRTFRLETYMKRLLGDDWRPQIKEMLP